MKKALITGITGQDGSYLLKFLLNKGYEVHGIKRRASSFNTNRIDNLYETNSKNSKNFKIHFGDVTDYSGIVRLIKDIEPDEIYHLAAMSHVKVSFDIPLYTAQVNAIGTHNILEGIRSLNLFNIKFYNASTSELYGKVQETPQSELTPFYPRSPYAVSKQYAHWITRHYREAFGIFACNGILFNHESPVRGETFITRKITRGISSIAYGLSDFITLGNLNAQRDWGYAGDYVELMYKILNYEIADDWVIGTGNSISIRDFIIKAFLKLNVKIKFEGEGENEVGKVESNNGNFEKFKKGKIVIKVSHEYFRPTEVETLKANPQKAITKLGWTPKTNLDELIEKMIKHDLDEAKKKSILTSHGFNSISEKYED